MQKCAVCGKVVLWTSLRDGDEGFCSPYCATLSDTPGFCAACAAATEECLAPSTDMSMLGGSVLVGGAARCPTCHSIVQRHVYFALFVPIWWRTRYRVIYTSPSTYMGRKLVA